MSEPDGKHKEIFREEAHELLGELEQALLELENNPTDSGQIGRAFRALHTIKGSGSMFGFEEVVAFAHEFETVFDLVRNGEIPVTNELISISLESGDLLKKMLDSETGVQDDAAPILEMLRKLFPKKALPSTGCAPANATKDTKVPVENPVTYRLRFRPSPHILSTGTDPVLLINELRGMGKCKVIAQTEAIPDLESLDPEACYLFWDVILTTSRDINAIKDIFIFVERESELRIDLIDKEGFFEDEADYKKLGEILIERGDLDPGELEKILAGAKPLGERLVESGVIGRGKVASALVEQQYVREKRKIKRETEAASNVRVPSRKLDKLADLVGELVTVQARLSRFSAMNNSPDLTAVAESIERLTVELRDNIMSARLIPIEAVFGKLRRTVRDLSAELGKEVELEMEGAETELDKSLIERLSDPLMHLVRNSLDHGIEPPDMREASGKPRKGVIRLSAVHSGASVLISVKDDGKGLDPAAIKARATEMGLISPGTEVADRDLYQFIFASGFSTAREITKVSGRGVGMDVVKKNIESLRGTIEIESRRGMGTSVTLKLPLTLAIIDGLLVRIADSHFVVPLPIVKECIEHTYDQSAGSSRRIANVRGEIVPYISLRDLFGLAGDRPEMEQIVITETDGRKIGFLVDNVIGEYQTVIKTLGGIFRNMDLISGATILGDGSVALILATGQIVKYVEQQEARRADCETI